MPGDLAVVLLALVFGIPRADDDNSTVTQPTEAGCGSGRFRGQR